MIETAYLTDYTFDKYLLLNLSLHKATFCGDFSTQSHAQ